MTEKMIEIKRADRYNFCETSMDAFDRSQEVQNVWRMENGRLVLKRWQEYTEELYKKDLHDPDNHDGVITDLFQSCGHCRVFQMCLHIECSPFTASSLRI